MTDKAEAKSKAFSGSATERSTARTDAPASNPLPEWVRACCSSEPNRPTLHHAVVFQFEGEDWTGATTGHRLAAVRGVCDGIARATDVGAPDFANVMKRPGDPDKRHEIRVREFAEWLGFDAVNRTCTNCEGKGEWECDKCSGVGYHDCTCDCGDEHERDCKVCSGRGLIRCDVCFPSSREKDYGKVFGLPFDRSILRPAITRLPYVTCYLHLDGERAAWLYDDSGAWVLLVMSVRPETLRDARLPAFDRELAVDSSVALPEKKLQ